MGVLPELSPPASFGGRRGLALPSALLGLVLVSVLAVGIHSMTDLENRSIKNRESAARALMLAEAGTIHAMSVLRDSMRPVTYDQMLRGSDGVINTFDDGRLIGFNLSNNINIPVAGRVVAGGTYTLQIVDDPADGDANLFLDRNSRVLARCTGITNDGARATLEVVIGATPFPAIAANGNLTMAGTVGINGPCGGVHANQNLLIALPSQLSGTASASGVGTGAYLDATGATRIPLSNQPPVTIPPVNQAEICQNATHILNANGTLTVVGPPSVTYNATSTPVFGFKRSSSNPVVWDLSGDQAPDGLVCATGNVKVSGNTGTKDNPRRMSLVATGSVEVSGNPFLLPFNNDSVSIVAGGDVSISGNPEAANENFEGLIYAGSQCKISGNPRLAGQVMCANNPNPAGTVDYAGLNEVSGNPTMSYGCGGYFNRRRILHWVHMVEN